MIKRMLSRVTFEITAHIVYEGTEFDAEVKNVSLSGLYFSKGPDLPLNAPVTVRIELASPHSGIEVKVPGIVVRKDADGFAVKLGELELDAFIFLRNIIVYNSGNAEIIDKEYRDYLVWRSDKNEYIPS